MSEYKYVLKIIFLENLYFPAKEFGFCFLGSGEPWKVFEQGSDMSVKKMTGRSSRMGWSGQSVSLPWPQPSSIVMYPSALCPVVQS